MNKYVITLGLLCALTSHINGMEQETSVGNPSNQGQNSQHVQQTILDGSTQQVDAQPAPAAETIIPTIIKKSCVKEAAKKIAAVVGHAIYSPIRAGNYVWEKTTTSRPYKTIVSLPGKTIHGTRTAAQSIGRRIAHVLRTVFGKLKLGDALEQYKPKESFDLQAALHTQGCLVHRAHSYVFRRTFGFGALATLIGSGSAYRTFGKDPKTAVIGLVSGLATGLISYANFRHQANLSGIYALNDRIVKRAIEKGVTANQVEQAFASSDHALLHVGLSGLNAMRYITDQIKYWDNVDRGLKAAVPADGASSSR